MPGLTLVHDDDGVPTDEAVDALGSATFFEDDGATVLHDGNRAFVGRTGWAAYPVKTIRTDDAAFFFEGRLYDVDDVESAIRDVGTHLLAGRDDAVTNWIEARDGDFFLVAVDEATGRARALVDSLARLPVYLTRIGSTTVCSRELKVVRRLADRLGRSIDVDRLAVAQTLAFGYRLGTRTLYENVRRLPPGALASIEDHVGVRQLHRPAFGATPHASRSVEENAAELADRFETACRRRAAAPGETVVGLSGGLDSRAVAAGVDAAGIDFTAATFDLPDGGKADEVRAARSVADVLDVPWESYVAAESDRHRQRLLETKQGMNYLRLSFLLDFLESLADDHGRVTYLSGDGGDKTLPDLTPGRSFADDDALCEFLIADNCIFDPGEAAAIAGVDRERLVDSVRDRLQSYPESDPDDRYAHFLVRERGMNWLFQGEDRNRYYHWTVTPFYARPFFEYAMRVPAEQKAGGDLRRAFLAELAPALLDVEYANYGAPVTSTEYRLKRSVSDLLSRHPSLQSTAVDLVSRLKDNEMGDARYLASEIRDRTDGEADGATALDHTVARRVASDSGSYSPRALYHLLTVASLPATD